MLQIGHACPNCGQELVEISRMRPVFQFYSKRADRVASQESAGPRRPDAYRYAARPPSPPARRPAAR